MNLGPMEIGLIILAVLLLFGYKKLPDASRSMGRSMRIFKSEMKGMKDDDVRAKDEARTSPVTGEIVAPAVTPGAVDYEAEAAAAEARAAEARARAEQVRSSAAADGTR
ncbi:MULTISPECIES: Sec-independent protein translocase subunit TatA [Modestobacter]|jgi:sec-independent protein translocase protein TatA|uniref:Sec-independent protein translocase protein TatA n=1 Tax=Modestobacter caceresii TaxID=1522368 RepID=A0A098YFN0_9ACTN|nr:MULTISPECIES: Sec-independent protein translocase subunit TatA [Modestobacter]KGH48581.1 translocase [Modestobacter caceresii]MCZ2820323.1 Sec-independent protein translocase subunit TatA [Modestobacter sp. VKM Ac-2977]